MPFTSDVVLMLCVVAFGIFGVLFLNRKWQIERKILTLYFAVMLVSAVEIVQFCVYGSACDLLSSSRVRCALARISEVREIFPAGNDVTTKEI